LQVARRWEVIFQVGGGAGKAIVVIEGKTGIGRTNVILRQSEYLPFCARYSVLAGSHSLWLFSPRLKEPVGALTR
jgi:hypothetical protein